MAVDHPQREDVSLSPRLRASWQRPICHWSQRQPQVPADRSSGGVHVDSNIVEQLRNETGGEVLDLSWLDQPAAERGLRIAGGKRGLTLEDIATKSYGDIPDTTTNQSGRMRGA